jgi:hypothetical protein
MDKQLHDVLEPGNEGKHLWEDVFYGGVELDLDREGRLADSPIGPEDGEMTCDLVSEESERSTLLERRRNE